MGIKEYNIKPLSSFLLASGLGLLPICIKAIQVLIMKLYAIYETIVL